MLHLMMLALLGAFLLGALMSLGYCGFCRSRKKIPAVWPALVAAIAIGTGATFLAFGLSVFTAAFWTDTLDFNPVVAGFILCMLGPFALASLISSIIVVTLYRFEMRKCHAASLRELVEVLAAVAVGALIAYVSSWCNPDVPIPFYSYPALLAIGIVFGLWGRCSPLMIGPATGLISIYWALKVLFEYYRELKLPFSDIGWGSPAYEVYEFEVVMFLVMSAIVLMGAVIGRVARRYWKKKRLQDEASQRLTS